LVGIAKDVGVCIGPIHHFVAVDTAPVAHTVFNKVEVPVVEGVVAEVDLVGRPVAQVLGPPESTQHEFGPVVVVFESSRFA